MGPTLQNNISGAQLIKLPSFSCPECLGTNAETDFMSLCPRESVLEDKAILWQEFDNYFLIGEHPTNIALQISHYLVALSECTYMQSNAPSIIQSQSMFNQDFIQQDCENALTALCMHLNWTKH